MCMRATGERNERSVGMCVCSEVMKRQESTCSVILSHTSASRLRSDDGE